MLVPQDQNVQFFFSACSLLLRNSRETMEMVRLERKRWKRACVGSPPPLGRAATCSGGLKERCIGSALGRVSLGLGGNRRHRPSPDVLLSIVLKTTSAAASNNEARRTMVHTQPLSSMVRCVRAPCAGGRLVRAQGHVSLRAVRRSEPALRGDSSDAAQVCPSTLPGGRCFGSCVLDTLSSVRCKQPRSTCFRNSTCFDSLANRYSTFVPEQPSRRHAEPPTLCRSRR